MKEELKLLVESGLAVRWRSRRRRKLVSMGCSHPLLGSLPGGSSRELGGDLVTCFMTGEKGGKGFA